MADVSVRPARPDDAGPVARVQLATWRAAYADVLPAEVLEAPEEEVAAVWRRAVEVPPSGRHRLLVALEHEEVVGLAASEPAEGGVELSALLVGPGSGRRGHGARLLAASVESWRADGAPLAWTWAWESDAATAAFLASAGWGLDGASRSLDTGARQLRWHVSLEEDA